MAMHKEEEYFGRAREAEAPLNMGEWWTCPFCEQTVRMTATGLLLPPTFAETCQLPDYMAGDECIALFDPEKAKELIDERE